MAKILNKIAHYKVGLTNDMSFWDFFVESAGVLRTNKPQDIGPWIITQIITMLFSNIFPQLGAIQQLAKLTNKEFTNNSSVKETLKMLNNSATKKGVEYLKSSRDKYQSFTFVKSKWLIAVGFIPTIKDPNYGSLLVTFNPRTTKGKKNPGGKKPVITPPWFSATRFGIFAQSQKPGQYYLRRVAIGNADIVKNVMLYTLRDKFAQELKYINEIRLMNDKLAYEHIVNNSNQILKEIPGLEKLIKSGKDNPRIQAIYARNELEKLRGWKQENANFDALIKFSSKTWNSLAEAQRLLKRAARTIKNPLGGFKSEIKSIASYIIPDYKHLNMLLDIGFRKGSFTKQKIAYNIKKDVQALLNKKYPLSLPGQKRRKDIVVAYLENQATYADLKGQRDKADEIREKIDKIKKNSKPSPIHLKNQLLKRNKRIGIAQALKKNYRFLKKKKI